MKVESGNSYLEALLLGRDTAPQAPTAWLRNLRMRAVEQANALTVPTTRDEDWRFTDLSPLYKLPFRPAQGPTDESVAAMLHPYRLSEATTTLVFVDGCYAPALSDVKPAAGVTVGNLAALAADPAGGAESHLGQLAQIDRDAFAAVNTAFLADGVLVRVAAGHEAGVIHVLFVASRKETAAYPRLLVVAEAGAQCTLVEDYVGLVAEPYLTAAVGEVFVAGNAHVAHVKVQREGAGAFHIAGTTVRVDGHGRYSSWSVALGGRISRNDLRIVQAGEGTEFSVDGLALIGGRQLADTHSSIDHAHAHGRSRQLHKTIVAGAAHAVFNGKILVREGAQQTDSGQQSRNLLLSDKAHVDAKPQLEIFADDVKCAHGATVGQLEADELFYLKSRGLSDEAARSLLTYAFAADVIERIPVKSLVGKLESHILERTGNKPA
jgi:Fe-S cluster assembly protein SufD